MEEINKTKTIALIIINIMIYTIIGIILLLFNIIVKADTIIGNNYYIQAFNNNTLITDTVGTTTNFYESMNINKVLFLPTNNGDIPIIASEYYINISFLIEYNTSLYPSGAGGIPLSNFQIRVGGNTVATCDGQQFMQNRKYGMNENNVIVQYDYTCTNLIVSQNFNQTLAQATNTYLSNLKMLSLTILTYEFLDQNNLNMGDRYIGDTINDSSTRIIENNNENTERIINFFDSQTYDTQTPDSSGLNGLQQSESALNQYTQINFNSVDIGIDSNTSNWVWTTLTSILNTNALIMGMIISILSIGIIKLVLGR